MTQQAPEITLPCDFLIKIIGADNDLFTAFVKERVSHHFPDTPDSAWKKQSSSEGRFASFTVTLYLTAESDLVNLKEDLRSHDDFKLML